ncbi:IS630 family transposase [Amycolatopsis silviterrae]|uniref:IS630 family transposase n=1 Tax=Amycolatopsis silviterrae TaxID=1656914 RepID=A0ABW5H593_9PSEU
MTDPRRLSGEAQEDLRRRVVAAVGSGRSQAEVAAVFGVSSRSVSRWMKALRDNGDKGLASGKRGRRPEEQKALTVRQQARLKRAVLGKFPDQLALPGLVWTRGQVGELVCRWFGIRLSRVTIGKYLRGWGLSPQKPVRRAYEQDPGAVRCWLEETYPAISARARREGGAVLWLDQTGLRSDNAVGASWAPVGRTPVIGKPGVRFGANAMAAISNKGELYFTVYHGSLTTEIMTGFLDRLTRHLDRRIHLVADRHPVHRSRAVRDWITERADRIELHFLPGYSPELNPVELLNGDTKHHVAQTNPGDKHELATEARTHLRRRQNQPDRVKAFFGKEEVRYAAE